MAIVKDLVIEEGESYQLDVIWRTKSTRVPVDLTGCILYLQARAAASPSSPLLIDASTLNGRIVVDDDPTTGKFTIDLSDEYIRSLTLPAEPTLKRAQYELICLFGGQARKLMKGPVLFFKTTVYP